MINVLVRMTVFYFIKHLFYQKYSRRDARELWEFSCVISLLILNSLCPLLLCVYIMF